ncbi:MAG TPA: DNA alkylation repair protein [Candidatus Angelobacter sp.]|nr:DNA alkylation repair protein [Candidatus Angelobacter sp.]
MTYKHASQALHSHANPARTLVSRRYFKNSSQDVFLGVTTPQLRIIAREYQGLSLADVRKLMQSRIHEERSLANEILRIKFRKSDPQEQKRIFEFYVKNRKFIREWDGVDGSAPYIVGPYLLGRSKKLLYDLVRSPRLWDRRIAIVSTLWFIREGKISDTLKLARMLLCDEEDLIHKATGWMLREVGKQDLAALKKFLNAHVAIMPRTMLRYAIERFPESERKRYMARK